MIVFCTKYVEGKCHIIEAVNRAFRYMPDPIVIVDAFSEDFSYLDEIHHLIDEVIYGNSHYEAGAWWLAWDKFPYEESYYFLQDNFLINGPLPEAEEVTAPATFDSWLGSSGAEHEYAKKMMRFTEFDYIGSRFQSVVGNMFFCRGNVMSELRSFGLDAILPENKMQSMAFERIWGMCLHQLGYDIFSLGTHTDLEQGIHPMFHKVYGGRQ